MRVNKDMDEPKRHSSRVRQADLDCAIYRPLDTKNDNHAIQFEEDEILAFCFIGNEDERVNFFGQEEKSGFPLIWDMETTDNKIVKAEDRLETCAYYVFKNGQKRYYAKRNSRGNFFNPIGMYDEMRHNKQLKHTGKAEWEYREIHKAAFEDYLQFLKSKNPAWLRNAERKEM